MFPRAPRETKGGGSPTRRGQPQESPAAAAAAQIAKKNKNGSYGLHAFVHVCNLDVLQFTSSRQAIPHILQEEPASSHSRSHKAEGFIGPLHKAIRLCQHNRRFRGRCLTMARC